MTTEPVPNADLTIRRYGEFGRDWIDGTRIADPLADAVVADFALLPRGEGMAMFRVAAQCGINEVPDAPDSLRALFAEVDDEPAWLDHTKLDRAVGHLVRHMASYGIVLGAASLTSGAMNSTAGLPLVMTGRYASQAAVRSLEVGSWLEEILKPGGLRRHGNGLITTLRVRLIHAFVRRHLLTETDWDTEAWGAPIPQSYMAFTIVEFGGIALDAMRQLGVRYTRDELDDIYHFWRYVGLLNGVTPTLNPIGEADQRRIKEVYLLTAVDPNADDREFVRALTHDYLAHEIAQLLPIADRWKQRSAVAIVNGMTRAFLGDQNATKLGVPDTALKHLPTMLGLTLGTTNRVLAAVPGVTEFRTRRALSNHGKVLAEQRARYGISHDMVDTAPDNQGHPASVG